MPWRTLFSLDPISSALLRPEVVAGDGCFSISGRKLRVTLLVN